MSWLFIFLVFQLIFVSSVAVNESNSKKKKDIRDFTDADIERLYEEWEENDEDVIPDDEKTDYEKPRPDISIAELKEKVGFFVFV